MGYAKQIGIEQIARITHRKASLYLGGVQSGLNKLSARIGVAADSLHTRFKEPCRAFAERVGKGALKAQRSPSDFLGSFEHRNKAHLPAGRRPWFGAAQKPTWVVLALGLICVSGCTSPEPVEEQPAQPVKLYQVGQAAKGAGQMVVGVVRYERETPLAFLSDGRLQNMRVQEGDQVVAGQLLANLDPVPVNAELATVQAQLGQANAELKRQQALLDKGWVSKARVEIALANAQAARAAYQGRLFLQRHAQIIAPTAGEILLRDAEPGQAVQAGRAVLILGERASGYIVRAAVSAEVASGLRLRQAANVHFRDGLLPDMAAHVVEVAGRANPATAAYEVELALPTHPGLKSGLIVDVRLPSSQTGSTFVVPATALFAARADEAFVWVFDAKTRKAKAQIVKLGQFVPGGVEILSGLEAGVQIVNSGVDRISEGLLLQPVADPNGARHKPDPTERPVPVADSSVAKSCSRADDAQPAAGAVAQKAGA